MFYDKEFIGKKFKEYRKKANLTQEALAEKIGIATRTLCGIEIGKNFFTADTFEKILEILEITPQDLFKINHLKPQEELDNSLNNILFQHL